MKTHTQWWSWAVIMSLWFLLQSPWASAAQDAPPHRMTLKGTTRKLHKIRLHKIRHRRRMRKLRRVRIRILPAA